VKARNDSGKDLEFYVTGQLVTWKSGTVTELTENQWNLIMGSTDKERESARLYWRAQFPDALPHLIPLRGRGSTATPETKEE
jgi:hypothetical protein